MIDLEITPNITQYPANSPAFCHLKWRQVIRLTEREIQKRYPNITLIGPFGFELLGTTIPKPHTVRRLYIYAHTPMSINRMYLAEQIQAIALNNIRIIYPEITDDFVMFCMNEDVKYTQPFRYACKPTDKLLDIQIRYEGTDILSNYANYTMLLHQSILQGVGESQDYQHSLKFRSRMFQLFLIQEALYKDLLSPLNIDYTSLIKQTKRFVKNSIQILLNSNFDTFEKMTRDEEKIIKQYVIPRSQAIVDLLKQSCMQDDIINLNMTAYHVPAKLQGSIGKQLHNQLKQKVIKTYEYYLTNE